MKYKKATEEYINISQKCYENISIIMENRFRIINPLVSKLIVAEKILYENCGSLFTKFNKITDKFNEIYNAAPEFKIRYDPCLYVRGGKIVKSDRDINEDFYHNDSSRKKNQLNINNNFNSSNNISKGDQDKNRSKSAINRDREIEHDDSINNKPLKPSCGNKKVNTANTDKQSKEAQGNYKINEFKTIDEFLKQTPNPVISTPNNQNISDLNFKIKFDDWNIGSKTPNNAHNIKFEHITSNKGPISRLNNIKNLYNNNLKPETEAAAAAGFNNSHLYDLPINEAKQNQINYTNEYPNIPQSQYNLVTKPHSQSNKNLFSMRENGIITSNEGNSIQSHLNISEFNYNNSINNNNTTSNGILTLNANSNCFALNQHIGNKYGVINSAIGPNNSTNVNGFFANNAISTQQDYFNAFDNMSNTNMTNDSHQMRRNNDYNYNNNINNNSIPIQKINNFNNLNDDHFYSMKNNMNANNLNKEAYSNTPASSINPISHTNPINPVNTLQDQFNINIFLNKNIPTQISNNDNILNQQQTIFNATSNSRDNFTNNNFNNNYNNNSNSNRNYVNQPNSLNTQNHNNQGFQVNQAISNDDIFKDFFY